MPCKCQIKFPDECNYCSICGVRRKPDKAGSVNPIIFCDECGKAIHPNDNYCWFCREPNRFRIAKLVYLLAEKVGVED